MAAVIKYANAVVAVVTLDGERWTFLFPPLLYRLIDESLNISANTP